MPSIRELPNALQCRSRHLGLTRLTLCSVLLVVVRCLSVFQVQRVLGRERAAVQPHQRQRLQVSGYLGEGGVRGHCERHPPKKTPILPTNPFETAKPTILGTTNWESDVLCTVVFLREPTFWVTSGSNSENGQIALLGRVDLRGCFFFSFC